MFRNCRVVHSRRLGLLLAVLWSALLSFAAEEKANLSSGDIRRWILEVGYTQGFPDQIKLWKLGSARVEDTYFHVFVAYLRDNKVYRTMVFANDKRFLGYYETMQEPADLDGADIVFDSQYNETDADGDTETISDSQSATLTKSGPERSVDLNEGTVTFVPAPDAEEIPEEAVRFLKIANKLADAMNRKSYSRIADNFSGSLKQRYSSARLMGFVRRLIATHGRIRRMSVRHLSPPNEAVFTVYLQGGSIDARIALNDDDELVGLWFYPFREAPVAMPKHETEFRLPFRGTWFVMADGDLELSNYKGKTLAQPYVLKFVVLDAEGLSHREDGQKLEDFYAFDRSVVAPADGTVVDVVSGVRDNAPGVSNPFSWLGNAITIQHTDQEYSVLSHLKQGSITVTVGDEVKAGQEVGRCGNSGNSQEPHIGMQIQNSPVLQEASTGKSRFNHIVVVNKGGSPSLKSKHVVKKGEWVASEREPETQPQTENAAPPER